jgi:hypothetical protein
MFLTCSWGVNFNTHIVQEYKFKVNARITILE